MKKLIVVTMLTFALVFSAAMIASAAPTVNISGEVDFGKDFNDQANVLTNHQTHNIGYAQIKADANITDGLTAHIGFKADPMLNLNTNTPANIYTDEAWFQLANQMGSLKIGHLNGFNMKSGVDIMTPVIADFTQELQAVGSLKVMDGLTVNAFAANDDTGKQGVVYGAGVAYANEVFGGDATYFKPYASDVTNTIDASQGAIDVNAWYKIGDIKAFCNYEKNDALITPNITKNQTIVGASYDSATIPVYARAEYNLQQNSNNQNPIGYRVGYKLNSNAKIEYQAKQNSDTSYGNYDDQYLKAIVTF